MIVTVIVIAVLIMLPLLETGIRAMRAHVSQVEGSPSAAWPEWYLLR